MKCHICHHIWNFIWIFYVSEMSYFWTFKVKLWLVKMSYMSYYMIFRIQFVCVRYAIFFNIWGWIFMCWNVKDHILWHLISWLLCKLFERWSNMSQLSSYAYCKFQKGIDLTKKQCQKIFCDLFFFLEILNIKKSFFINCQNCVYWRMRKIEKKNNFKFF